MPRVTVSELAADGSFVKVRKRHNRYQKGVEKRVDREMKFTNPARFRLLLKGSLMEFYLDDILIESFALPAEASGRIGVINSADTVSYTHLRAHET